MALAEFFPLETEIEVRVSLAPEPHVGYALGKRVIDLTGALGLLLVALPLIVITACLILFTSGRPILFGQKRMGQGGKVFTCWKFRTMVKDAEARRQEVWHMNVVDGPAFKNPDDPRLTKLGKWLRQLSLDEMPQLINVIRGEMSLVGPRPLPIIENRYSGEQASRLSVKPGLTCIWQISGRSGITFDRWMEMDLEYVRCRSLVRDVGLILLTVPALLTRRGAV